jgi:hypothetical protein
MTLMDVAQLLGNFGEFVGAIAVIATLSYLAIQVRNSTVQARASAYQATGVAFGQYFLSLDDRTLRLISEANYAEALRRWTLADWEKFRQSHIAALRILEGTHLQVEQGLLSSDAMERFGITIGSNEAVNTPGFRCIWPDLRNAVGPSLRILIDDALGSGQFDCPVDIHELRDQTILESLD